MKAMKIFRIFVQWMILSFIMTFLWAVIIYASQTLFGIQMGESQGSQSRILLAMLAVGGVNTAVLMIPILRSRWHGMKLLAATAFCIYIVQFFQGEIEVLFFDASLQAPAMLVYSHLTAGAVFAFLYGLIACAILGRLRERSDDRDGSGERSRMPTGQFMIKFLVLSIVIYPLIYFLFGYFVAWQSPHIREYYSGITHMLPFFRHFENLFRSNPLILPWQMFRGLIWVLVIVIFTRMQKGPGWMKALSLGLFLSLLMNAQMLIPNPIMPADVRFVHFIETASSNFLFGLMGVWLFNRRHVSFGDYFRGVKNA